MTMFDCSGSNGHAATLTPWSVGAAGLSNIAEGPWKSMDDSYYQGDTVVHRGRLCLLQVAQLNGVGDFTADHELFLVPKNYIFLLSRREIVPGGGGVSRAQDRVTAACCILD